MKKYVISANYRDRNSPNKWLVRLATEHPDNAVERATVHAKGVIFCPSSDFETGFGCTVVAYADEIVEEGSAPENSIKLRFEKPDFVDDNNKVYEELAEMHLAADGSIMGLIS